MPGKLKLNKCSAGLTLTEVVIASAILIIGIVPVLKGLTSANLGTTIIEQKSRSLILAQAKLDEIKARSVYHYSQSYSQSNMLIESSYLCNITDTTVSSNLRKIIVQVGFDYNNNDVLDSDEIDISLATYIAKRWES
jgi:Tfp pilus assembly protein PilV